MSASTTRIRLLAVVGAAAAASLLAPTGARAAVVHHVVPGQSIQAAIDRSHPGDTVTVAPGAYRENLTVLKDGIRLRGAGAGPGGTRLLAPSAAAGPCAEKRAGRTVAPGICAAGRVDFRRFEVVRPLRGVQVSGFAVTGFFDGALLIGVDDAVLEHNRFADSAEDGVLAVLVRRPVVRFNTLADNSAGLRLTLSRRASAQLVANTVTGNRAEGIGVEDAQSVTVRDNRLVDNAGGVAVLDLPGGVRPTGIRITGNDITRNDRVYGAEPPLSGTGILLAGVVDSVVAGNRIWTNTPGTPTPTSGGIVVRALLDATPRAVTVRNNVVHDNRPDLVYDGSGADVAFVGNACGTSRPAGLC